MRALADADIPGWKAVRGKGTEETQALLTPVPEDWVLGKHLPVFCVVLAAHSPVRLTVCGWLDVLVMNRVVSCEVLAGIEVPCRRRWWVGRTGTSMSGTALSPTTLTVHRMIMVRVILLFCYRKKKKKKKKVGGGGGEGIF